MFVEGKVIARRSFAEGLFSLTVAAPVEPHQPGQFLNIGLSIEGRPVRRAYSLASVPRAPLEFYLVELPGGTLTPALNRLAVGDEIDVDPRPHGFFVLSELPPARELWLLATGTGLAPYLAMLREGRLFATFERVMLAHGVRLACHLGYRDELEQLAARENSFRYLPAVSRQDAPGALRGRLTALLASGELERAAGAAIDPGRAHVMLCGNPEMIDDATLLLGARGLKKHRRRAPGHITVEKYW